MITPALVAEVAALLAAAGGPGAGAALRGAFPGLQFTFCLDDDIARGEPVHEGEGFNLYLVDGSDHCLRISGSFEHARGIVVAEKTEE